MLTVKVTHAQGIFALLAGDIAKATNCIGDLADSSRGFSFRWEARSLSYHALLIALSHWPLPFRFPTEFGGSAGNLFAMQIGYFKNSWTVMETMGRFSTAGSEIDIFERNTCRFLSMVTMYMHFEGHMSHSFFPQALQAQSN